MAKKTTKSRSADTEAPSFTVGDHMLVAPHEKCSEAEKKRVLSTYNVTAVQLPRILDTDPAIRHLGVQAGDLIKIVRVSPTAGSTVFYRIVTRE